MVDLAAAVVAADIINRSLILSRFQDETNYDTIAACQGHDESIGNSSRKREPWLPKAAIFGS